MQATAIVVQIVRKRWLLVCDFAVRRTRMEGVFQRSKSFALPVSGQRNLNHDALSGSCCVDLPQQSSACISSAISLAMWICIALAVWISPSYLTSKASHRAVGASANDTVRL
eukprot:1171522-Rhodomonas_salina.4